MKTLLILVFTSTLVVVLGEPPSEPWGSIGNVKEEYSDSYNAPKSGNSYGAPAKASSSYGAPAKASSSYGAPAKAYGAPISSGYGAPVTAEYGAPVTSYGPPKSSGWKAPVKHHHHTTYVYVKKGRRAKKSYGKWIWVPRLPRLKVIPHKVSFRAPRIHVQKPKFRFSPPRFIWW